MKKLLFIFLLFPLLVLGQAEKTHRSIIIDSLKAFNGGIIDVKDTVNFEKPLKGSVLRFTDDVTGLKTLAELAASGVAGDSSFVTLQTDTNKAFNNTTIQTLDSSIFQEHLQTNKSFEVNKGLSLFKGIDATSTNFALKVQDNVDTDLLSIRNDGKVGIGGEATIYNLEIIVPTVSTYNGLLIKSGGFINAQLVTRDGLGGALFLRNNLGEFLLGFNSNLGDDFIDTGKKLGIGTQNPTSKVTIKTANAIEGALEIVDPDDIQKIILLNHTKGGYIVMRDLLGTTDVVRLNNPIGGDWINTGNNFGIGTEAPSEKFTVNGNTLIVGRTNYFVDTSSVNDNYGVNETLITSYTTGMNLYVNISVANTGAATLQINALAAKTIKKLHDQDLVTGDIEVGQIIHVIYDGTNFQMLSQLGQ